MLILITAHDVSDATSSSHHRLFKRREHALQILTTNYYEYCKMQFSFYLHSTTSVETSLDSSSCQSCCAHNMPIGVLQGCSVIADYWQHYLKLNLATRTSIQLYRLLSTTYPLYSRLCIIARAPVRLHKSLSVEELTTGPLIPLRQEVVGRRQEEREDRQLELSGFVTPRGIFGEKCKNHLFYTIWVCWIW